MKCPECGNEMIEGTVQLEDTAGGFLFFGISYKHCFFRPNNPNDLAMNKFKVLSNSAKKESYYCESCDLTVIK